MRTFAALGRDAVIASISSTGKPRLRHIPTRASGQAAVAWYMWSARHESYLPTSIEVLALEGTRVKDITAFASPGLFSRFGLPGELPREG